MAKSDKLDEVTALKGDPSKLSAYYDTWAADYDRAMSEDFGFIGPRLVAEAEHRIAGAAQLEGAGILQDLQLAKNLGARR